MVVGGGGGEVEKVSVHAPPPPQPFDPHIIIHIVGNNKCYFLLKFNFYFKEVELKPDGQKLILKLYWFIVLTDEEY